MNHKLNRYTSTEIVDGLGLEIIFRQQPTHIPVNSILSRVLQSNPYSLIDAEEMFGYIDPSCGRGGPPRIMR